jgi:hypothetical protein
MMKLIVTFHHFVNVPKNEDLTCTTSETWKLSLNRLICQEVCTSVYW